MSGSPGGVDGTKPEAPRSSAPACYRHPGRETYIRCSRCERYICPDCMTAAPVGFQCPECIAEGSKGVRQPTTVLGGQVRERSDLVTKILIGINVGVWLVGMLVGQIEVVGRFALATLMSFQGEPIGVLDGEWYRMITAAFVHEQFWHIGLNMYALWILGGLLEPVLGRSRFLALYLVSALGGSAASLLGLADGGISSGASGAVFGLMGALFVVMRRFGRDVSAVLVILGINVVFGFVVSGIDWRAHLGGLVTGALLAYAFAHAPRKQRALYSVTACMVVVGGIVALMALLVA
ncbi:MAG: rhomboid family intramembrane serine protease [Jiangellaceae bacterium]